MALHELAQGAMSLPGGVVVDGFDTPEGRLYILTEEFAAALQRAYLPNGIH